jgi:hypothetical protein
VGRVLGAVAAVATVAVVGSASLLTPAATAAPPAPEPPPAPAPVWAPATTAAIRPGVITETAGGGVCTTNFVFTSGSSTYIGQAAHCGGTGEATETDGCTSATVPLGTAVTIKGADGRDHRGTLAYSSWVTMQAGGESDPDTCAYNDLALVAVDAAGVNPSVPFFGGPTGIDTDGLVAGERVYTYGNTRLGDPTPKVGVNGEVAGGGRSHVIYTLSPGVPGDSGSAFLDATGAAIGQLSTLNLAPLPVSNGVGDIATELAYAEVNGGLGDIELVLGTEPFDPAPAGLSDRELATPAGPPLS